MVGIFIQNSGRYNQVNSMQSSSSNSQSILDPTIPTKLTNLKNKNKL